MGVLSDRQIADEVSISPFFEGEKREGIISYGLSSYGYDIRIGNKFKIFTPANCAVVDPKNFNEKAFVEVDVNEPTPNNFILIPPNSFALGFTVEHLKIPRDMITICLGKSTYARCGIVINVTPFEPEWEGHATIEISNTTPLPAKIYANEGIAQILFLRSDENRNAESEIVNLLLDGLRNTQHEIESFIQLKLIEGVKKKGCGISYADKKGKYQNQKNEVVLPKVEKLLGKPKLKNKGK